MIYHILCLVCRRVVRHHSSQFVRRGRGVLMTSAAFDYAPLFKPGLPAPAGKWGGLAKYNFIGGNNDADQVPVDALIAASAAVLQREGRNARDLRACARAARLPAAARFPHPEAQARRRHRLQRRRHPRHLGLVAGDRSRQWRVPGARRHRDHRAGMLPGLDQPADEARRQHHRHPARPRRHAHGRAVERARRSQAPRRARRNTSTPSRPCRIRPARIMPEPRRAELLQAVGGARRADRSRTIAMPT